MDRDPDYLKPAEFDRRLDRGRVAEAPGDRKKERLQLRRVPESNNAVGVARHRDLKVADVSIVSPGVRVSTSDRIS